MLRVNGETVDPDLIDEAFHRIKSGAEAATEISCCERDEEFRRQAEAEVIEGVLLAQEAEKRVPDPPAAEVREALEDSLREWRKHGASWDLLEARRDQLRDETVARLRMEKFAAQVWGDLPDPDESALRAWFAENPDRFRKRARARVRHLVRFPDHDPQGEYRLLLSLRERALGGEDFAALADGHTAREDKATDLGWIEHERLLNGFETMLFSLREGEVSPVFFYEQCLHLVRIEKLEPEHVPAFEEIGEAVREACLADQRREALHQLALELRKTARIEAC
jgi:hypothetical protein